MDAEQFRKFQEFQQFQEFQRYREETGQLPPAPKPPLWKRALRSKLVRKLVVLLILLIAAYWAYQHYFGKNDSDNAIEAGGGGRTKTNFVFSDNPMAMVRQLYDNVAQNIVVDACNRFTDDARQKFTADLGAPSCELAVTTLNSKLTNKHKYSLPRPGSNFTIPPGAKTIEISSCDLRVEGGPRIGVFVLSEIELGQWIITGHRNEPDPCPAGAR
ncbi:hypothetical protein [Herbihabitans rhizosphaerae]|nr:hypothetical protein [Herbihabitans rhizosphaerae]